MGGFVEFFIVSIEGKMFCSYGADFRHRCEFTEEEVNTLHHVDDAFKAQYPDVAQALQELLK
jgi:hypothetical protein